MDAGSISRSCPTRSFLFRQEEENYIPFRALTSSMKDEEEFALLIEWTSTGLELGLDGPTANEEI
jgi:hypothetical protein